MAAKVKKMGKRMIISTLMDLGPFSHLNFKVHFSYRHDKFILPVKLKWLSHLPFKLLCQTYESMATSIEKLATVANQLMHPNLFTIE